MTERHDLWYGTSGPQNAEIVIVGESWGVEEAKEKRPFIGTSGTELNRMLEEAGIDRNKCLVTNVVAERPHLNETFRLFAPKDTKPFRINGIAPTLTVDRDIRRLYKQILAHPRKLVIACGNWSLWAVSQRTGAEVVRESNGRKVPPELQTWAPNGIMNWRGSMWYLEPHAQYYENPEQCNALSQIRLLPLIHPAAIMRAWYNRAPTLHDLKARVPLALRGDWRPNPTPVTLSPPSFSQAINRLQLWLDNANRGTKIRLANDIETIRKTFISCIGFADSTNFAMCIPFVRRDNPDGSFESFWTPDQEAQIVGLIRRVLSHPNIHIIGQNYIYDLQFIQYWMGVTPRLDHDTMLAQNVIFPGTPKALEYLSSLYCHYHWYWKEDHKDWDKLGDLQRLLDYNCIDNLRTWEIDDSQRQYIKLTGQEEQMRFKMQTNDLCLRMMNRGVLIDKAKRGKLVYELEEARNGFYRELLEIIPQELVQPGAKVPWYRSPKQTGTLFYDLLGFRMVKNRKTGRPTVGKEALMQFKKWYPEFTGLFERLDTAGSVDNSLGVVQTPVDPDGRMRCSYNPGGTETHRLSSSANVWGRGTNLQNLSKGEEDD
jgi:uracil-DNA glycosylase